MRHMSLFIASINSGSNGNCYYIGNEDEAILVDAGISCRETVKRMKNLDLDIDKVKAIFISHEHGDHIRGVEVLSARYKLPVYITPLTLKHSRLRLEQDLTKLFKGYEQVQIGNFTVYPFPKCHDAADPHSFIIEGNGVKIGVFTDIGSICEHVISHFKQCHAVFLEANYDEAMLENGRYPYHLKKRISGDVGHLSNIQALELFKAYKPSFMSHVLLSHLSKDNNDPVLAADVFKPHSGNTKIIIASRYKESDVYTISGTTDTTPIKKRIARTEQIALF